MTPSTMKRPRVSFDDEPLILVDEQDNDVGHLDKWRCHAGAGVLHRAFSVFVFDDRGRVLLQRRSAQKPLWPLFWSNSCCSHPRRGEAVEQAVARRLHEELGLSGLRPEFLYKFRYRAAYENVGTEHELCYVFGTTADQIPQANPAEIDDLIWVTVQDLDRLVDDQASQITPWAVMEWRRIRSEGLHPNSTQR